MTCRAYGKAAWEINWKSKYQNNVKHQNIVAKEVKRRQFFTKIKKNLEVGRPLLLAPLLHIIVEQQ